MRTPRHGLAVMAVGTSVYAVGGAAAASHARSTPTNEVLDLSATPVAARSWRAVRDAPTARQQLPAAEAFGTVWLFGGLTDAGATAKVEGYDPAIDTWKSGPDLPLPLHHQMAVTFRGELVVLGGWAPENSNPTAITSDRVFVLQRGNWAELPRLLRPRAAGAAAVVADKIVVVGGKPTGSWWPPPRSSTALAGGRSRRCPLLGTISPRWPTGATSTPRVGEHCRPTGTRPPSSATTRRPTAGRSCPTCRRRGGAGGGSCRPARRRHRRGAPHGGL